MEWKCCIVINKSGAATLTGWAEQKQCRTVKKGSDFDTDPSKHARIGPDPDPYRRIPSGHLCSICWTLVSRSLPPFPCCTQSTHIFSVYCHTTNLYNSRRSQVYLCHWAWHQGYSASSPGAVRCNLTNEIISASRRSLPLRNWNSNRTFILSPDHLSLCSPTLLSFWIPPPFSLASFFLHKCLSLFPSLLQGLRKESSVVDGGRKRQITFQGTGSRSSSYQIFISHSVPEAPGGLPL